MVSIKVALLQLLAEKDNQVANLKKGDSCVRRAKQEGADIVLFPEMWNIGYSTFAEDILKQDYDSTAEERHAKAIKEWQSQAIDQDSDFVLHFRNLARELNIAIAITYLEKYPVAPRNSVSLIDRHGEIQYTYAKVHTCDFSTEAVCSAGDDFYVCDLDTDKGPVKIGAMICYDREFPESARILMLKGAEIILTPNASDMGDNRICQFKTRAFENMLGVALANYASPQHNGHSCAFDCIAFDDNSESRDTCIVMAGREEGIHYADFDLRDIREWRSFETWGNAYRKPAKYSTLVAETVNEPFIRKNAKR